MLEDPWWPLLKTRSIRKLRLSITSRAACAVCALVAQLDRASDFESEGREFESLRARQPVFCYHRPRMTVPEHPAALDRIFVHDFVLPVRIGAFDSEHEAPQQVRFTVDACVARPARVP